MRVRKKNNAEVFPVSCGPSVETVANAILAVQTLEKLGRFRVLQQSLVIPATGAMAGRCNGPAYWLKI
jgi:hypothetical protein